MTDPIDRYAALATRGGDLADGEGEMLDFYGRCPIDHVEGQIATTAQLRARLGDAFHSLRRYTDIFLSRRVGGAADPR